MPGLADNQSAQAMALGVKRSVVGEQSESHALNLQKQTPEASEEPPPRVLHGMSARVSASGLPFSG